MNGKNLILLSKEDWEILGKHFYGDDKKDWEFKCVKCGNIQSLNSVMKNAEKDNIIITEDDKRYLERSINFSCEGRINKNRGCNWTLGGLFRIHKAEVVFDGGKSIPTFIFSKGMQS